jgi:hypothetical protein
LGINYNAYEPGLFIRDLDDFGNQSIRKIGPTHLGDEAPNISASFYQDYNIELSNAETWVDSNDGEDKYLFKIWDKSLNGGAGKWVVVGEVYGRKDNYLDQFKQGADGDDYIHTLRDRLKINDKTALRGLASNLGNQLIINEAEEFANGVEVEAKDFYLTSGAIRRLRVTSSGDMKIGGDVSIAPAEKLEVVGSVQAVSFIGSLTGSADTATKLNTPRTFTLSGDVTGTTSSDLTSGFAISTTIPVGTVTSAMIANGTIVNEDISSIAAILVSKLAPGTAPRQLLQTNAAGSGVEWANSIRVPGTLDVGGISTFESDVVILGDLLVQGTETILNTQTLSVEDKNIEIGVVEGPNDAIADGGGITLKGTTNKTLNWVLSTASWTSSEHFNLFSGKIYKINGVDVLSSTTLGAGVTQSSLTSVGTISSGTWQGSAISDTYLQTITTVGKVANSATTATSSNTPSTIVLRNGSGGFSAGIITASLDGNAATATKLNTTRTFTLSGDVTGTTTSDLETGFTISASIPSGTVTSAMIANGTIVDEDINANAGIVDTKLATVSTANKVSISSLDIDGGVDIGAALSDSDLFIVDDNGNGTNRKAAATRITNYAFGKVTGDITIGSTGTAAISNGVIVNANISATAEIAVSKLADGSARQLLQTAANGTDVEWASNIDIPGTLDVTGVTTFDSKVKFGVAEPIAPQEAGWSADIGTLELGLSNDLKLAVGADTITLCRNTTASPIAKGAAVMFAGTVGASGRLLVAPMVADGTMPGYVFFGVAAETIASGADGFVISFGKIRGVNTSAWPAGSILWCDPANPGGLTATEPEAPNLKLSVAAVVFSGNNGILMVRWDTGRRLADLHDVESNGSTQDGEVLIYNAASSRWEHSPDLSPPGTITTNGVNITALARDVEEARLIRKNATLAIGVPGTVPFGVGPIVPPGMALGGIGPDAYNVIDFASGSFC